MLKLLKSDSVNSEGAHAVTVIVNPVQSTDNGTMIFLTDKDHDEESDPLDRIFMNTVNSGATYGSNYTVKVLSILSMEDYPVEYVDTESELVTATDEKDGVYSLPAGSYKVTVDRLDGEDRLASLFPKPHQPAGSSPRIFLISSGISDWRFRTWIVSDDARAGHRSIGLIRGRDDGERAIACRYGI